LNEALAADRGRARESVFALLLSSSTSRFGRRWQRAEQGKAEQGKEE
jgi:hypothetical protein